MYGQNALLHFVTTCFCVLYGTQVQAFFYDALDPTKAEFEEWHQRDPRVALRDGNERYIGCNRPNIYICEEPPQVIPAEATKTCNYRSVRYHEQVYKWVAGRGCLLYTPDFLYTSGYNNVNLNAACLYGGLFAPCIELPKSDGTCGCFPFDPAFQEVANIVRQAIIPAAHGRWENCFYTASECCSHHMSENVTITNQCEPTFDGWSCWDKAEADTVSAKVCSEFAYSNTGPSCNHYSTKQCFSNGTWELQTDYSTCSVAPRLLRRYRFHIAILSFSIAACLPAVFIFFFYKRLRVTRVALHRNLLIAIITRNILVIISRSAIYIDELTNAGDTVMSTHGMPCQVLAIAERIAVNCVFVAMLVEGIYLHRTIVAVFRQKLNIFTLYVIGAFIAIIPVVAWAVVMGVLNNHSCFLVYTVDNIQWILDAPRIAILLINTGLFIDVLRVLLTKLRNSENANQLLMFKHGTLKLCMKQENKQTFIFIVINNIKSAKWSTTKATLFLMPIFGTQFFFTAFRPTTTDCTGEQIYYYLSYTIEGLQGFIVSMLYCYVNKEVHTLIRATYKKTENAFVSRVRKDSNNPRTSNVQSDRRLTCSTGVPSYYQEDKEQYTIQPKLHVAEIISIQASERLAEILEPVYETIQNGIANEGYDSLDRSQNGSSCVPRRYSKDDYYAFTNASSVSIDCQDWIRCVSSPSSSVYNNSLNDYEARYLERKFPNHPKLQHINQARERNLEKEKANDVIESSTAQNNIANIVEGTSTDENTDVFNTADTTATNSIIEEEEEMRPENEAGSELGIEDSEMLDEIMQYITQSELKPVALNPELLCPNRKEEDKIIFVDE